MSFIKSTTEIAKLTRIEVSVDRDVVRLSRDSEPIVLDLVRASYTSGFGLEILSKQQNAQGESSIDDALKLEEQQRPQKEAALRQKQADDLALARQKNKKAFQP